MGFSFPNCEDGYVAVELLLAVLGRLGLRGLGEQPARLPST